MQLTDTAIILSTRKYGEHAAIVSAFGRTHGLVRGMARHALSSKQRGIYQPGNIVSLEWRARLEEQLGSISCELETAITAMVLQDKERLAMLTSACALIEATMQERDAHPTMYDMLWQVCAALLRGKGERAVYGHFELALLRECGFRLELEQCAVTGETQGLCYVSPKTGKAVTAEGAGAYKERLLTLPAFLQEEPELTDMNRSPSDEVFLQALRLSGHFLQGWLFSSLGRELPAARMRLEGVVS